MNFWGPRCGCKCSTTIKKCEDIEITFEHTGAGTLDYTIEDTATSRNIDATIKVNDIIQTVYTDVAIASGTLSGLNNNDIIRVETNIHDDPSCETIELYTFNCDCTEERNLSTCYCWPGDFLDEVPAPTRRVEVSGDFGSLTNPLFGLPCGNCDDNTIAATFNIPCNTDFGQEGRYDLTRTKWFYRCTFGGLDYYDVVGAFIFGEIDECEVTISHANGWTVAGLGNPYPTWQVDADFPGGNVGGINSARTKRFGWTNFTVQQYEFEPSNCDPNNCNNPIIDYPATGFACPSSGLGTTNSDTTASPRDTCDLTGLTIEAYNDY